MQMDEQEQEELHEAWEDSVSEAWGKGVIDGFILACALLALYHFAKAFT